MSPRPVVAAVAGFALLALAGGAYLWHSSHAAHYPVVARVSPPPPPPRGEIDITGTIEPRHVVYVNAPFEGRIADMPISVGQSVSQGQMLARLQSPGASGDDSASDSSASDSTAADPAIVDLDQAQSRVDDLSRQLADQRLAAATARAAATQASDDAAKLRAVLNHQSFLYSQGATPKLKLDAAQSAYTQAHKDDLALSAVAQQAQIRLDELTRDLGAASALLGVKTNDAETASEQAAAGMLLAPVSGVITALAARVGDEVSPAIGNLIEIATDLTELQVAIPVTPTLAAQLKPGMHAELEIAEAAGAPIDGIVGEVKNGQATVQFVIPSPGVRPGSSALVRLRLP